MTRTNDASIEQALEAYIAANPEIADRDAAIATILENWFTNHGYLPQGQEGTRPEDLDSTNDD
jgi:NADH:ubiquinone oxidoreductase subunit E